MRLHNRNSLSTTLFTIFTILTLNHVALLVVNATPQPSMNHFLQVRHADPNPNPNPNQNPNHDHPSRDPFDPPDQPKPKPTPPAELLQHAKNPPQVVSTITITASPTGGGTPAASSAAPSFLNYNIFTSALLNSTNFYRAQHNASSVSWNSTLASFASSYLDDKLGISSSNKKCELTHSRGPYGENLALGCSDVQSCVEMWGNERAKYDFGKAKFGEDTGHFTQLVWKNTTDVGCAARWCGGWNGGVGGWYLVCEYWPRGNVVGEFGSMVERKVNGGGRVKLMGWMGWQVVMVTAVVGGWLVFG